MSAIRAVRMPQADLKPEEARGVDLKVLVPVLALVSLGVAMVFSASIPMAAVRENEDVLFYLKREILFVALGLAAMWGVRALPMEWLREKAAALLGLTLALLAAVLLFGKEVNGARSWFVIPATGLQFQPSEMAKLVLVVAAARYFARFPQGISAWRRAAPPLVMLGLAAVLIAVEPDMGSAAVMVLAMFVYFSIAGLRLRHVMGAGALAMIPAAVLVWLHPYQLRRILDFSRGAEVELAGGYQRIRSLVALGSGGLTGCGYCGSVEKYFYLPTPTTDSILPVIGEELGLVATWAVVALFAYLVWRGMAIAGRAPDRFSGLVAAGVTCVIGVQALLNIAVATGSVPATGVTLPFVSYGGSSLLFSLIGVGLLLNVSRSIKGRRAARGR